jgi:hypothetical protein
LIRVGDFRESGLAPHEVVRGDEVVASDGVHDEWGGDGWWGG